MKRQYITSERAHFMCPDMHFGMLMEVEKAYEPEAVKATLERMALAHPFLNLSRQELEIFLPQAVGAGLDGMEVRYSKFTPEQSNRALEIAEQCRLLPSGGSDYHGTIKADIAMGTGRGDLEVPKSWYQSLKTLAQSRKMG